jgi:dienelactone hydrolase
MGRSCGARGGQAGRRGAPIDNKFPGWRALRVPLIGDKVIPAASADAETGGPTVAPWEDRKMSRLAWLAGVFVLLSTALAQAAGIGIVLLHTNMTTSTSLVRSKAAIVGAGYDTETREMCWSERRLYDRPIDQCLDDITAAADALRQRGADQIVLAGHAMGGMVALYYAARHPGDIAGIVAFGPALSPRRPNTYPGVVELEALVSAGLGSVPALVQAINRLEIQRPPAEQIYYVPPANYLSFFGPPSPLVDRDILPALQVPVLWLIGNPDATRDAGPARFALLPPHILNRLVEVPVRNSLLPEAGLSEAFSWLEQLNASLSQPAR